MTPPDQQKPGLITRWWVQLLVAVWILAVIVVYYRLQLIRFLQILGIQPGTP